MVLTQIYKKENLQLQLVNQEVVNQHYYICFGGVDTPTSGSILVDGEEIRKLKGGKLAKYRRNKVGIIYQFFNLLPILNVEENITLPASLDGRKIDKERLNSILEINVMKKY